MLRMASNTTPARTKKGRASARLYYDIVSVVDHLVFRDARPIEDEERRVNWTKDFVRHSEDFHYCWPFIGGGNSKKPGSSKSFEDQIAPRHAPSRDLSGSTARQQLWVGRGVWPGQ